MKTEKRGPAPVLRDLFPETVEEVDRGYWGGESERSPIVGEDP